MPVRSAACAARCLRAGALLFAWLLPSSAWTQTAIVVMRADGRAEPIIVYEANAGRCAPLALISPGAGGTEQGLAYLAIALRKHGWTALVLGHTDSGPDALRADRRAAGSLRAGLLELTTDRNAYFSRFLDITTALSLQDTNCRERRAVLIGHSMGAATVMLEAGAANRLGLPAGKDRFDAYVALSPQGPGSIFPDGAWRGIGKPVLLITGTRDQALEGGWQSRTRPFGDMPPGCKALAVVDGATHLNFAGIGFTRAAEDATTRLVLAFLDGVRDGYCPQLPVLAGVRLQTK
jgi:predicted dienelactone hydrolase